MKRKSLPPDDIEFLRQALRQVSIKWPGRAEALRRARKKVFLRYSKKGKALYKFHWKCARCKNWFRNVEEMEVDHIVEIGAFTGDWNSYLLRHFPNPKTGLQVLCVVCHLKKTKAYNSARSLWQRKTPTP